MSILDNYLDRIMYPLAAKYMRNEDYYFLDDQGKRVFNSGRVMYEERDYFHPIFHPSPKEIITAFFVDDAPLIYCDSRYGEQFGSDFKPDDLILTPQWEEVIRKNSSTFFAKNGKHYETHIASFDCDRELRIDQEVFA